MKFSIIRNSSIENIFAQIFNLLKSREKSLPCTNVFIISILYFNLFYHDLQNDELRYVSEFVDIMALHEEKSKWKPPSETVTPEEFNVSSDQEFCNGISIRHS